MGDVTRLLNKLRDGDESALERLMPLVYEQLRAIARIHMRRERPDHTLSPTALVHDAFLKLLDQRKCDWRSRSHFFSVALEVAYLVFEIKPPPLAEDRKRFDRVPPGRGVH